MTGSDPISARYHGTLTSGSRMVRATWLMVPSVGVVARSDAAWGAVISRPLPSRAPADPASAQCRPGTPEQTRAVRADGSGRVGGPSPPTVPHDRFRPAAKATPPRRPKASLARRPFTGDCQAQEVGRPQQPRAADPGRQRADARRQGRGARPAWDAAAGAQRCALTAVSRCALTAGIALRADGGIALRADGGIALRADGGIAPTRARSA